MKFKIDQQIFSTFPDAYMGAVIVKDCDNTGSVDGIQALLRIEEARIMANFESETLSQEPKINSWRKVYSTFGVKPKEAKSSVENMYKMVTRGMQIRNINKLVDIYNFICLKYMLPVGGEDLDKIVGNLQLTIAGPNEMPVKLLGTDEDGAPNEGEVFYKDDQGAVCRRWNWREADRTKLTEQTKNCVIVIEAIAPATKDEVKTALTELNTLIKKYCGGETTLEILDANNLEVEL